MDGRTLISWLIIWKHCDLTILEGWEGYCYSYSWKPCDLAVLVIHLASCIPTTLLRYICQHPEHDGQDDHHSCRDVSHTLKTQISPEAMTVPAVAWPS